MPIWRLADVKVWTPGLTHGRGWIAVALVIFARWRPWRAFFGALLFGGIEALIPQIAAAGFHVPQYFMLMTPYIATLAVMVRAGIGKGALSGAPLALGPPLRPRGAAIAQARLAVGAIEHVLDVLTECPGLRRIVFRSARRNDVEARRA